MAVWAGCWLNFLDLCIEVMITCAGNEWQMIKLQEENNVSLKLQHVEKSGNIELELKTTILPKNYWKLIF